MEVRTDTGERELQTKQTAHTVHFSTQPQHKAFVIISLCVFHWSAVSLMWVSVQSTEAASPLPAYTCVLHAANVCVLLTQLKHQQTHTSSGYGIRRDSNMVQLATSPANAVLYILGKGWIGPHIKPHNWVVFLRKSGCNKGWSHVVFGLLGCNSDRW